MARTEQTSRTLHNGEPREFRPTLPAFSSLFAQQAYETRRKITESFSRTQGSDPSYDPCQGPALFFLEDPYRQFLWGLSSVNAEELIVGPTIFRGLGESASILKEVLGILSLDKHMENPDKIGDIEEILKDIELPLKFSYYFWNMFDFDYNFKYIDDSHETLATEVFSRSFRSITQDVEQKQSIFIQIRKYLKYLLNYIYENLDRYKPYRYERLVCDVERVIKACEVYDRLDQLRFNRKKSMDELKGILIEDLKNDEGHCYRKRYCDFLKNHPESSERKGNKEWCDLVQLATKTKCKGCTQQLDDQFLEPDTLDWYKEFFNRAIYTFNFTPQEIEKRDIYKKAEREYGKAIKARQDEPSLFDISKIYRESPYPKIEDLKTKYYLFTHLIERIFYGFSGEKAKIDYLTIIPFVDYGQIQGQFIFITPASGDLKTAVNDVESANQALHEAKVSDFSSSIIETWLHAVFMDYEDVFPLSVIIGLLLSRLVRVNSLSVHLKENEADFKPVLLAEYPKVKQSQENVQTLVYSVHCTENRLKDFNERIGLSKAPVPYAIELLIGELKTIKSNNKSISIDYKTISWVSVRGDTKIGYRLSKDNSKVLILVSESLKDKDKAVETVYILDFGNQPVMKNGIQGIIEPIRVVHGMNQLLRRIRTYKDWQTGIQTLHSLPNLAGAEIFEIVRITSERWRNLRESDVDNFREVLTHVLMGFLQNLVWRTTMELTHKNVEMVVQYWLYLYSEGKANVPVSVYITGRSGFPFGIWGQDILFNLVKNSARKYEELMDGLQVQRQFRGIEITFDGENLRFEDDAGGIHDMDRHRLFTRYEESGRIHEGLATVKESAKTLGKSVEHQNIDNGSTFIISGGKNE